MPKKKYPINELVAENGEAPVQIQVGEILKKLEGKNYEWLLIVQQYDDPCDGQLHDSKESLVSDMGSALTCHCLIAAIYYQGRQLSDAEIAPLRLEALNGLGPISRAKADGLL